MSESPDRSGGFGARKGDVKLFVKFRHKGQASCPLRCGPGDADRKLGPLVKGLVFTVAPGKLGPTRTRSACLLRVESRLTAAQCVPVWIFLSGANAPHDPCQLRVQPSHRAASRTSVAPTVACFLRRKGFPRRTRRGRPGIARGACGGLSRQPARERTREVSDRPEMAPTGAHLVVEGPQVGPNGQCGVLLQAKPLSESHLGCKK
jgi:hypothetical protein